MPSPGRPQAPGPTVSLERCCPRAARPRKASLPPPHPDPAENGGHWDHDAPRSPSSCKTEFTFYRTHSRVCKPHRVYHPTLRLVVAECRQEAEPSAGLSLPICQVGILSSQWPQRDRERKTLPALCAAPGQQPESPLLVVVSISRAPLPGRPVSVGPPGRAPRRRAARWPRPLRRRRGPAHRLADS